MRAAGFVNSTACRSSAQTPAGPSVRRSLCSAALAQALTCGAATAADVNDSRIIGPDGQGPEQQLALATIELESEHSVPLNN